MLASAGGSFTWGLTTWTCGVELGWAMNWDTFGERFEPKPLTLVLASGELARMEESWAACMVGHPWRPLY